MLAGPNCALVLPSGDLVGEPLVQDVEGESERRRACRVPQSFSGFCCEWACLIAIRFGLAALNAARSAAVRCSR